MLKVQRDENGEPVNQVVPIQCSEQDFLDSVKDHEMTIKLDIDGYTHLRFERPHDNNRHFDLLYVRGVGLTISGDMGTYVFPRDFDYFRKEIIQPMHWSKQLLSHSGYREFSEEVFKRNVLYAVGTSELEPNIESQVISELEAQVFNRDDIPLPHAIYHHFESEHIHFDSAFGDSMEYTYHYVWCTRAIAWGISLYDKECSDGQS